MNDQHKTQARNCIANYCHYPRTTANELVAKMTDAELQAVLDVGNQLQTPAAEKKVAIDKILDDFTQRLEKDARGEAVDAMKEQQRLHATQGRFGTPPAEPQPAPETAEPPAQVAAPVPEPVAAQPPAETPADPEKPQV